MMRAPADFVYTIPDKLSSAAAAPLLCAGEHVGFQRLVKGRRVCSGVGGRGGVSPDSTRTVRLHPILDVMCCFLCTRPKYVHKRVCSFMCPAGVTVYAPLRKYVRRPDCKVAVLGVGGLGHLAVQFADKMGADVSVNFFATTVNFSVNFTLQKKEKTARIPEHLPTSLADALGCHCVRLDGGREWGAGVEWG